MKEKAVSLMFWYRFRSLVYIFFIAFIIFIVCVCFFFFVFSENYVPTVIGRGVGGLSIGIHWILIPIYINDVVHVHQKPLCYSIMQLQFVFGILSQYILFSKYYGWKWYKRTLYVYTLYLVVYKVDWKLFIVFNLNWLLKAIAIYNISSIDIANVTMNGEIRCCWRICALNECVNPTLYPVSLIRCQPKPVLITFKASIVTTLISNWTWKHISFWFSSYHQINEESNFVFFLLKRRYLNKMRREEKQYF